MNEIKHIWLDFSETLAFIKKDRSDRLRYETYADVTGKTIDDKLIAEYEELYKKHSNSNSAIFYSLGKSSNFWSEQVNNIPPQDLYELADPNIPNILQQIRKHIPISIFSGIQLSEVLPVLGIDPSWFTHILSGGMVEKPKPALDGFYKMIDLSGVPAQNILYIGDHIDKDIRPAKQVGVKAGLMWSQSNEADYSFEKFEDILKLFL